MQGAGRATADHGGAQRTTAKHGGHGEVLILYTVYSTALWNTGGYCMPVAGPLPFPTITGVWERRRGVRVGRGIGRNIRYQHLAPEFLLFYITGMVQI